MNKSIMLNLKDKNGKDLVLKFLILLILMDLLLLITIYFKGEAFLLSYIMETGMQLSLLSIHLKELKFLVFHQLDLGKYLFI